MEKEENHWRRKILRMEIQGSERGPHRPKIYVFWYINILHGFPILQEYGDSKRAQALWDVDSDDEEEDILEPNPKLSQGNLFNILGIIDWKTNTNIFQVTIFLGDMESFL